MLKKPYARSFWVEEGKLLAGCYPADLDPNISLEKMDALSKTGVKTIINLMEETEVDHSGANFYPYIPYLKEKGIETTRFPIKDGSIPSIEEMKNIQKTINTSIENDKPVYVHCWGGRGRTGTVVGCWLVDHGWNPEEALEYIAYLRRGNPDEIYPAPEMASQFSMVRDWQKEKELN